MRNKDIYQNDPSKRKLPNEGVANVNDDAGKASHKLLRYELETFVCSGQYHKGLYHILDTFKKNLEQAQQPGVWVSGLFGSGKSHLVKMLRALWADTHFEDGASSRDIANLPDDIRESLRDLSVLSKAHGGLHAASGTLGAGASGSVRLALLRIILKSAGLPEQYSTARFVLWLQAEGLLDEALALTEKNGFDWQKELDNFYVSESLHQILITIRPNLFSRPSACVETLNNLFPFVTDISSDEMVKTIKQALSKHEKFPLTAVIIDEVQQFIGQDSLRSHYVQEVAEACCKKFGGKLLFIATGQTAIAAAPNLKKLEGRFTIRIELSDADVNTVVRRVILAKKPNAIAAIEQVAQNNLGEISRHLSDTSIAHSQDDIPFFAHDYPILPVRRRFWEAILRALDPGGADCRLRNYLSLTHKAIQTNLSKPLGHIIPADYLYFDIAQRLLQTSLLPRKIYDKIMAMANGSSDEKLLARACGLVFLINRSGAAKNQLRLKTTFDNIADLMVENLTTGAVQIRDKLMSLLNSCELLMKINDEFYIQTEESSAMNNEFLKFQTHLGTETHRIDAARDELLRNKFCEIIMNLTVSQGLSKVNRRIYTIFNSKLPEDSDKKVYVWVRDGWSYDKSSVLADAKQAGNNSPTIFVFIPKPAPDNLRLQIIKFKAACSTLEKCGVTKTPKNAEARAAIETIKLNAWSLAQSLLDDIFSCTLVFQAGGNKISSGNLQKMTLEAAENSFQRLYPQFAIADDPNWENVYSTVMQGGRDALKAVGNDSDPNKNPVCKAILNYIADGRKGIDIHSHFENSTFGWPDYAIDGAIQALLVTGFIRALDEHKKVLEPEYIERKQILKAFFIVELTTISTAQRIQIRKLFQRFKVHVPSGEEHAGVSEFLQKMHELAERAGGESPKPQKPETTFLEKIRQTAESEQLLSICHQKNELLRSIDEWSKQATEIEQRWRHWETLKELLFHANNLNYNEEIKLQISAIINQRLLLVDPDPVLPLLKHLEDILRNELTKIEVKFSKEFCDQLETLEQNPSWKSLPRDKQQKIFEKFEIEPCPKLNPTNGPELLELLNRHPISAWQIRIDALPQRFNRVREEAAKFLDPEARIVNIPKRTLRTVQEVDEWLNETGSILKMKVAKGPIIL